MFAFLTFNGVAMLSMLLNTFFFHDVKLLVFSSHPDFMRKECLSYIPLTNFFVSC